MMKFWEDSRFGICQPKSTLLERRRSPRRIVVEKIFHFSATFTEDVLLLAVLRVSLGTCCTLAGPEGLWIFHFYDTAPTGPTRFFLALLIFFRTHVHSHLPPDCAPNTQPKRGVWRRKFTGASTAGVVLCGITACFFNKKSRHQIFADRLWLFFITYIICANARTTPFARRAEIN